MINSCSPDHHQRNKLTLCPVSAGINIDDVNDYIVLNEASGKKKYLCKISCQSSHRKDTIKRHLEVVHTKATYDVCQFCFKYIQKQILFKKVHHAQSVNSKMMKFKMR